MGSWNLHTAQYTDRSYDVGTQISSARGITIRADGEMIYVVGRGSNNVAQYSLSEAGMIDTASFVGQLDIQSDMQSEAQGSSVPHGIYITTDGVTMYIWNRIECFQYTLSTPWDVTTGSRSGYINLSSTVTRGHDIDFKPDGTVFYVEDRVEEKVFQFNLSTAWDIETASFDTELNIAPNHSEVRGIEFKPDGDKFYLLDTGRSEVQEYRMSTNWNVATASFERLFDTSSQASNPTGISFYNNGQYMYIADRNDDVIYQYELITDPVSVAEGSLLAYYNDQGTLRQVTPYYNDSGTLREIDPYKLAQLIDGMIITFPEHLQESVSTTPNIQWDAFDWGNLPAVAEENRRIYIQVTSATDNGNPDFTNALKDIVAGDATNYQVANEDELDGQTTYYAQVMPASVGESESDTYTENFNTDGVWPSPFITQVLQS